MKFVKQHHHHHHHQHHHHHHHPCPRHNHNNLIVILTSNANWPPSPPRGRCGHGIAILMRGHALPWAKAGRNHLKGQPDSNWWTHNKQNLRHNWYAYVFNIHIYIYIIYIYIILYNVYYILCTYVDSTHMYAQYVIVYIYMVTCFNPSSEYMPDRMPEYMPDHIGMPRNRWTRMFWFHCGWCSSTSHEHGLFGKYVASVVVYVLIHI